MQSTIDAQFNLSRQRSRFRHELTIQAERSRRHRLRWARPLALAGAALLVWVLIQPVPWHVWPLMLAGMVAVLPWLTTPRRP